MKLYGNNKLLSTGSKIIGINKIVPKSFKYYQLVVITPVDFQFADFKLVTAAGVDKTSFTVLAGQQGINTASEESYEKAFDGRSDTKWYSNNNTWNPKVGKVIFTKNEDITVMRYGFMTASDHTEFPTRAPIAWTLRGTNKATTDFADSSWELVGTHLADKTIQETLENNVWVNFTPIWGGL